MQGTGCRRDARELLGGELPEIVIEAVGHKAQAPTMQLC